MKSNNAKTASAEGVTVTDCGDYFRVRSEGDGGAGLSITKSYGGFETAAEVLAWMLNPLR